MTPRTPDFAATSPTYVASPGWHPPTYLSWEPNAKVAGDLTHYAVGAGNEDQPSAWIYPQAIDLCGGGFVQLVRWSVMEPTQGNYDFSAITTALNWLSTDRVGKKMFVRMRDKSYLSSNGVSDFLTDTGRNMPDYLAAHVYTVYQVGAPATWR